MRRLEREVPVFVTDVRTVEEALAWTEELRSLLGGEAPPRRPARRRAAPVAGARVATLVWREPLVAVGEDTYAASVLAAIGLANVFSEPGGRYPRPTLDDLAARRPERVVLPSEPHPWTEAEARELEEELRARRRDAVRAGPGRSAHLVGRAHGARRFGARIGAAGGLTVKKNRGGDRQSHGKPRDGGASRRGPGAPKPGPGGAGPQGGDARPARPWRERGERGDRPRRAPAGEGFRGGRSAGHRREEPGFPRNLRKDLPRPGPGDGRDAKDFDGHDEPMPRDDDDDAAEPERPERGTGGFRERGGRRRGKLEGRGGPRPESPAPPRAWTPPERDSPPVHGRAVVDASDFAPPVRPAKPPAPEAEDEVDVEEELDADDSDHEHGDDDGADEEAAAPEGEHPARARNPLLGPLIVSRKNARIHLVRSLATRRGRKREGKFLVEGVKVIKELLDRAIPVELLLWQDGAERRKEVAAILAEARTRRIASYGVVSRLFDELTDTESSQGVLAVAPSRWQSLEEALGPVPEDPATAPPRAIVVAAGVQDPGNLGTIIRSARFLGISSVACLSGTTDPWAPKVVRASAGTILDAPPARVETLAQLTELAHARGFRTVALAAHGGRPLEAGPLPRRTVLLLGAEGPGLAASAVTAADEQITIKGSDPAAESLNAAMAFALFAHAWRTAWAPPG